MPLSVIRNRSRPTPATSPDSSRSLPSPLLLPSRWNTTLTAGCGTIRCSNGLLNAQSINQ
nr:hypothetical protein [Micromonospora chokoriensis]